MANAAREARMASAAREARMANAAREARMANAARESRMARTAREARTSVPRSARETSQHQPEADLWLTPFDGCGASVSERRNHQGGY